MVTTSGGFQFWIIAAAISCGAGVYGAALEIEKLETPFPLELQPPLLDNLGDAIDSYGYPIKFSQPIKTPDGRKVVLAKGVQFEIPHYASGITEIKKPNDNLVPPSIGESSIIESTKTTTTTSDDNDDSSHSETAHQINYQTTLQLTTNNYNVERQQREILIGDLALDLSTADLLTVTHSQVNTSSKSKSKSISSSNRSNGNNNFPSLAFQSTGGSNKNSPNFPPTDQSLNNSPHPNLEPIAVALPSDAVESQEYKLPDWLADFDDPDVGPGVPYMPMYDENSQKILSWDLIPPQRYDSTTTTTTKPTIRTFPTTTTTTTTTTPSPPTTSSTTTTTTTTTRAPITASSSNSAEFFALPGGDSQTLPSWLVGVDDPELSVAVPFEVPEDNNEYNHTLSNDLLPPLEPFDDLKTLNVPGFAQQQSQLTPQTQTVAPTITTKPPAPSTPAPFHFKFFSKQQPTTPSRTTPTAAIRTPTITESSIANRFSQFASKTAAQPSGFKANTAFSAQPRPTFPPLPTLDPNRFRAFLATTTTTTTTTTTETPATGEFLFDSATIPSWLSDFADPDLGPGVPFIASEGSDSQPIHNDLLPPSVEAEGQPIDGVTVQKSISSELPPLSFLHNSILSQSIPTTPQPFVVTTRTPSQLFTTSIVLPPDETNNSDSHPQINSIQNNNFAAKTNEVVLAPFAKSAGVGQNTATTSPAFAGKYTGGFGGAPGVLGGHTKQGYAVPPPTTPAPLTTAANSLRSGITTAPTAKYVKYTGSFGGAPGILGGSNTPGFAVQPPTTVQTFADEPSASASDNNIQQGFAIPLQVTDRAVTPAVTENYIKYTGRFGGAPGILGGQAKQGFAVPPPQTTEKPRSDKTTESSVYVKYTGGFGGAPGILGGHTQPGYAVILNAGN